MITMDSIDRVLIVHGLTSLSNT